ncbi:MAG: AraC family transcriptional regulator [Pedosphaera sp.]|nr:AraC family transcriptional regulator [Pedosphaera sp.]
MVTPVQAAGERTLLDSKTKPVADVGQDTCTLFPTRLAASVGADALIKSWSNSSCEYWSSQKPIFEKVPRSQSESLYCEVVRPATVPTPWHFHSECQLTLVLNSYGHRVVGDHLTSFGPGDLVFIGPNLPHFWHHEGAEPAYSIVVQFLEDFMGHDFLTRPELVSVGRLLSRSRAAFEMIGRTRQRVADRLEELGKKTGHDRLLDLLWILGELSRSRELCPLASAGFQGETDPGDEERMTRIWNFIGQRLAEPIYLKEVARAACLSETAFERYFRTRTGRTFVDFLNELRISRACRLLADTDKAVTEIAFSCKFENLANFNRQFLRRRQVSPRQFRARLESARLPD